VNSSFARLSALAPGLPPVGWAVLGCCEYLWRLNLSHFFSEMEIGYHFGPVPALDFSSICEHLPFLPQNTSQISIFQGHFQYAWALRAPPGVLGINEVLAKDLI